jgi:hypothetical protein
LANPEVPSIKGWKEHEPLTRREHEENTMTNAYEINLWGSHPDAGNDDCVSGTDAATFEEAVAIFNAPEGHFFKNAMRGIRFVEMVGSDVREIREVTNFLPHPEDTDCDVQEGKRLAAMSFGIQGYNDFMGY